MEPTMLLKIAAIRTDGGTQVRDKINPEAVEEYARIISEGGELPRPIVFYDGDNNWLADGFQRLEAHVQAGRSEIEVDRKNGSRRDAVIFSISANLKHGVPLTNREKHNNVVRLLQDQEWRQWSNPDIAKRCGVAEKTVRNIKKSLTTVTQENCLGDDCETSTEVDSGEQPIVPSSVNYERNGQVQTMRSPSETRAKRGSSGPKNGQIVFDWKKFRSHFYGLYRTVDDAGSPFKANNSAPAQQLRDVLDEWHASFKAWWSSVSGMEVPPDNTSHVFSEAK